MPKQKNAPLVLPREEWPYEVPENWVWTRLGNVLEPVKNKTGTFDKSLKFVGLENIEKDTGQIKFQSADEVKSTKNIFHQGDILYGKLRPYLNKHGLAPFDGICSTDILVFASNALSLNQFVDCFFHLPLFIQYSVENSKGINLPRVSESIVLDAKFPLPPLPEQQRIVDRIESLFANLDATAEKIRAALDQFPIRKAAILHKAFTGELTEKWREENGVGLESWKEYPLSKITKNHDGQRIPLSKEQRSKMEKIYDYYGASGVIDKVDNYLFEGKYLLIGEDGANLITRSKPIAFIADGKYWVNNHAHILSVENNTDIDFICAYINYIDLTPYVTGSAQPKMTQNKMNNIPIDLPSLPEQKEIVRILDAILEREQKAKETAENLLEHIDLTKKSILARAFRGKLGTNDPKEESAEEWLNDNNVR